MTWGGILGFGLTAGTIFFLREYILYIVKAGHVAVLVELIDGRGISQGQSQISYATGLVRERFVETNVLFAVDQIVKAVLAGILGLLQGVTALLKAGVAAKDVLAGGLSGALDLAAAGQMDVASAAETTATALNQFNLQGNQASHVADLLAAGANAAQGEVSDMAMALAQGGLVAHQTGLSVEETVAALTMFAKAGMIGLSHAVATTYARERIRSNVVAPSLVMTPMARRAANNPDTVAYAERKQPLARGFLQAGDIAAAVAWLCGDASAQITGQVIAVDGGWTVSDGR